MAAYNPAGLCRAERQWGICRLLQSVFILSALILASNVGATRLNDPAKQDDAALNGAPDAASDGGDVSDGETDEATGGTGGDSLTSGGEDLVSEVELKTIAPHPAGGASGSDQAEEDYQRRRAERQRGREARQADKERWRRQQEEEERAKAESKAKYDRVVQEMKEASAAYQSKPKSSAIYSTEPTSQESAYRAVQRDVAAMTPTQRDEAMRRYGQEQRQRKEARNKYDQVVEELKTVLERRRQRGAPGTGTQRR